MGPTWASLSLSLWEERGERVRSQSIIELKALTIPSVGSTHFWLTSNYTPVKSTGQWLWPAFPSCWIGLLLALPTLLFYYCVLSTMATSLNYQTWTFLWTAWNNLPSTFSSLWIMIKRQQSRNQLWHVFFSDIVICFDVKLIYETSLHGMSINYSMLSMGVSSDTSVMRSHWFWVVGWFIVPGMLQSRRLFSHDNLIHLYLLIHFPKIGRLIMSVNSMMLIWSSSTQSPRIKYSLIIDNAFFSLL